MKIAEMNALPPETVSTPQPRPKEVLRETCPPQRDEDSDVRTAIPATNPEEDSTEAVSRQVQKINEHLAAQDHAIRFSVDTDSEEVIVKLVDRQSGETIKQIPAEEILKMRERFDDMAGLLINKNI